MGLPVKESARVFKAGELARPRVRANPWAFPALTGFLAELSEENPSGAVSFAAELIASAQAQGETVAWIAGRDSIFYPPDFKECGVDLDGVLVVWAQGAAKSMLAADQLLRSGAFGLLVVDLGADWRVSDAALGRLARLSELHGAAVVFLTEKLGEEQSVGSLISLRGTISRAGTLSIAIHTTKDKQGATGSLVTRRYDKPGVR